MEKPQEKYIPIATHEEANALVKDVQSGGYPGVWSLLGIGLVIFVVWSVVRRGKSPSVPQPEEKSNVLTDPNYSGLSSNIYHTKHDFEP